MRKVRILLADDHRQFLMMVERLLASTCEVVGRVPDGQSLFDAARRLAPDVIVTDISMPILNGIEASKQLNKSGCAAYHPLPKRTPIPRLRALQLAVACRRSGIPL